MVHLLILYQLLSYLTKNFDISLHGIALIIVDHVVSKLSFRNVSILMYFTGAEFLRNALKETRDMTIFVLLCKNIQLCMQTCS